VNAGGRYDEEGPGVPPPAVVARRLEEQISPRVVGMNQNTGPGCWERGDEAGLAHRPRGDRPEFGRSRSYWTIPELARAVGVTGPGAELGVERNTQDTREFVRDCGDARPRRASACNKETGPPYRGRACRGVLWHAGRFATSYTSGSVSVPPRRCGPGPSKRFAKWHTSFGRTRPDARGQ